MPLCHYIQHVNVNICVINSQNDIILSTFHIYLQAKYQCKCKLEIHVEIIGCRHSPQQIFIELSFVRSHIKNRMFAHVWYMKYNRKLETKNNQLKNKKFSIQMIFVLIFEIFKFVEQFNFFFFGRG